MPFSIRLGGSDDELDPSVLISVGGSGMSDLFFGCCRFHLIGRIEIRYIASVDIGNPPTKVNLMVDTG